MSGSTRQVRQTAATAASIPSATVTATGTATAAASTCTGTTPAAREIPVRPRAPPMAAPASSTIPAWVRASAMTHRVVAPRAFSTAMSRVRWRVNTAMNAAMTRAEMP